MDAPTLVPAPTPTPATPEMRPAPVAAVEARRIGLSAEAWIRVALLGILALAGVLYAWDLSRNGWGNEYYAAAALAGSQDWTAWLFGGLDAGSFITVDKPPAALWVMGLSVRAFGLSSWSVLLPQALMGIAAVGVLFATVRRSFGAPAGLLAALLMAFTPVAVLMFRFDNPDAFLTLLLVLAAWALGRGLDGGRIRWAAASGALLGFAFLAKELQAWVVLPAFALTWLVAAPGSFWRRVGGVLAAGVATAVAGGWWVALVEVWPAASRPFIGGSTTDSALDRLLGYNGLARILGRTGTGGGAGPGGGFGGEPGLGRMFNDTFGGQISWLLPLALLAIPIGLWMFRRAGRTHPAIGGYLLWGGWLVTTLLVFSLMEGIVHEYYTVAMAPAVAALTGGALVHLWARRTSRAALLALAGLLGVTAWWASRLLDRTPDTWPGLATAVLAGGLLAAGGLALAALLGGRPVGAVLRGVALTVGLVAIAAGPAAYTLETVTSDASGSIVLAGPVNGGFGGFGGGAGGPGGQRPDGANGRPGGGTPGSGTPGGTPPDGTSPGRGQSGTPQGGFRGFGFDAGPDSAAIAFLVANQGDATWIAAVSGAQSASAMELASGRPVMAMGGWSGDPTPTLEALQAEIGAGHLRYVLAGQGGRSGFGRGGSSAAILDWVVSACAPVTVEGSSTDDLYDCGAAVTGG